MSDRPTWETDIHSDFNACMHREYCRELKRQRDAAVEALKDACLTCAAHGEQPPEKWLTVLREIEEGKS